jgi:hypothetical protein
MSASTAKKSGGNNPPKLPVNGFEEMACRIVDASLRSSAACAVAAASSLSNIKPRSGLLRRISAESGRGGAILPNWIWTIHAICSGPILLGISTTASLVLSSDLDGASARQESDLLIRLSITQFRKIGTSSQPTRRR